ncbi:MAG: DUF350 domain-containing protein [Candidatus Saccharibacteria bacterium]|nr:DUF350 domain-containing protein [Candidatus Saccharibacteria bacterium]
MNIDKLLHGLSWEAFLGTILYAVLGMVLFMAFVSIVNMIYKLDVRKELVKDNNIALGIALAGVAIALAIIIAGTINS